MARIPTGKGLVLAVLALAAMAAVLALALGRTTSPATAVINGNGVPELGYMYSAKFLCGIISDGYGPLADGEYATAINVHNLQDFDVHIYKKAVLAPVEPDVGEPSPYKELDVPPDAAFEIDCPDIASLLAEFDPFPAFIKGFVVIRSPVELDVWGVYTSAQTLDGTTAGSGISEDIEVVPFKRQPYPPPTCIDRLGDTQCDDPVNDPDDDGCASWEEQAGAPPPKPGATGAYDPTAWYDFYDVPVPAKADAAGANGTRNRAVALTDVLAVLLYVPTSDDGPPNVNGVDYDTIKGVDLDGDTTNDIPPPLHQIEEGVKYDRSPSALPNPPWEAGPPSGAVNMQDVLAVLAQVPLACTG